MEDENAILIVGDEVYLKDCKIQSIDKDDNVICTWTNEQGEEFSAVFKRKSLTKQPDFPFAGFLR
ncbi:hypothetical protein ACG94X_02405 [Acinetobacter sp. ULE_I010]|uniref:hypothetical protein n=1 Tax=Acinetobacter sp. ULE_I010 TaxID=3373065 RepID=UPI003AF4BEEC